MRRFMLFCLLISTYCGCAQTPKEDWWVYDGLHTSPLTQSLHVESTPPSSLWLDGEYAGQTPLDLALSYRQNRVCLIRPLPDNHKEDAEPEEKTEDISTPESHTLLFKASGHHDLYIPVTVPNPDDALHVRLKPKSSLSHPVSCEFTVRAEKKDMSLIRSLFSRHTLAPSENILISQDKKNETGMVRQTFRLTLKDADALADLMSRLNLESRKRHFIFNVRNAKAEADFSTNPTREFRAVWISYIDWPRQEFDPDEQKRMLTGMLDEFKRLNFNTVFFQVRPACDANYPSELAPWSALLTGKQGKNPGYDPLGFIIQEAHTRGLSLHAWLNPFRVDIAGKCTSARSGFAQNHIVNKHPDWLLQFRVSKNKCYPMLDPGIPAVRDHIADIVEEIVRRYDVDGIHFDDMFYPYPQAGFKGVTTEDRKTFRQYGRKYRSINDWRRDNINRLIGLTHRRIRKVKKDVCFGVSPFGIWKNRHPAGVTGMGSYYAIFTDPPVWLKEKTVDYLTPQLYWKIGGPQDYEKLLEWWAGQVREARGHIYPGQIVYYVGKKGKAAPANKPLSAQEIIDQLYLNRDYREQQVLGCALFRATNHQVETLGDSSLTSALAKGLFATPALPPVLPRLNTGMPSPPEKTAMLRDESGGQTLSWEKPSSGEPVKKYAVYAIYSEEAIEEKQAVEEAGHLIAVTGKTELMIDAGMNIGKGDLLFVTAVSGNNVESLPGETAPFEAGEENP